MCSKLALKMKRGLDDDDGSGSSCCGGIKRSFLEMSWKSILLDDLEKLKERLKWKKIREDGLDLDYCMLFTSQEATTILAELEHSVEYYSPQMTQVRVHGKWHNIPRKQVERIFWKGQGLHFHRSLPLPMVLEPLKKSAYITNPNTVAYGDDGLTYTFSGTCVPAKPWMPLIAAIRDAVNVVTNNNFNFILVNRYNNGLDYMGEHRDDERDLDAASAIASLSLGQERDFVLKRRQPPMGPLKIPLQHGSLLMMNPPTNQHWYHSLPVRKKAPLPRVNLTLRRMVTCRK